MVKEEAKPEIPLKSHNEYILCEQKYLMVYGEMFDLFHFSLIHHCSASFKIDLGQF